jgi:arginine/serine-rich splicing factor 4/5/6
MGTRVYVGNLSQKANERDLEGFFRGFGKIRDVMMKNGFGFVVCQKQ